MSSSTFPKAEINPIKPFKQHLQELLTKAYPYRKTGAGQFVFEDEKGNHYDVQVTPNHGRAELFIDFQSNGSVAITGNAASPFRVFSTVADIIRANMRGKEDEWVVAFNADMSEPSRVKLYERLAKIVQKERNGDIDVTQVTDPKDGKHYRHFRIYPQSDF